MEPFFQKLSVAHIRKSVARILFTTCQTQIAQALQNREEEMKRNLDELSATQAEMGRKQTELKVT